MRALFAPYERAFRCERPVEPWTAPSTEMTLAIPPLDLAAGATFCLHIPHECNEAGELVERSLLDLALRQGKSIKISRAAAPDVGFKRYFVNQSSADWLARTAGISLAESKGIIAGLGVRVADDLAHNAGTPRLLLGLAVALVVKPQVVAYSTSGLDVEGCRTVHRFVASNFAQMCSVHISHPSVFGDGSLHPRQCLPGARCIELAAEP